MSHAIVSVLVDKRLYVANECGHPIGIVIKVIKGAADADLYFDAVFMCLADKIGFEKAIGHRQYRASRRNKSRGRSE